MGRKPIDLTGQKFERLTVIKRIKDTKAGRPRWLCICSCGNFFETSSNELRRGFALSCGCLRKEKLSKIHTTHGQANSRLYSIWRGIKNRCYLVQCDNYYSYGGRGITVCPEWNNSFEAFYSWALANGYTDKLTIDRIDNSGNYCPENCRWVTSKEQARNRRNNRVINGKTLVEWAEMYGIRRETLSRRLRFGWDFEKALRAPKYARK